MSSTFLKQHLIILLYYLTILRLFSWDHENPSVMIDIWGSFSLAPQHWCCPVYEKAKPLEHHTAPEESYRTENTLPHANSWVLFPWIFTMWLSFSKVSLVKVSSDSHFFHDLTMAEMLNSGKCSLNRDYIRAIEFQRLSPQWSYIHDHSPSWNRQGREIHGVELPSQKT